jgi:hypothetical protein
MYYIYIYIYIYKNFVHQVGNKPRLSMGYSAIRGPHRGSGYRRWTCILGILGFPRRRNSGFKSSGLWSAANWWTNLGVSRENVALISKFKVDLWPKDAGSHSRRRLDSFQTQHVMQHQVYLTFLTPWSRVLLEKLTGSQLVKKFPAFYGSRRFITAFTSTCHLSLSWANQVKTSLLFR